MTNSSDAPELDPRCRFNTYGDDVMFRCIIAETFPKSCGKLIQVVRQIAPLDVRPRQLCLDRTPPEYRFFDLNRCLAIEMPLCFGDGSSLHLPPSLLCVERRLQVPGEVSIHIYAHSETWSQLLPPAFIPRVLRARIAPELFEEGASRAGCSKTLS